MSFWDYFLLAGCALLAYKLLMDWVRAQMLLTYCREVERILRDAGFNSSDTQTIGHTTLTLVMYRDGKKRTRSVMQPNGLLNVDPHHIANCLVESFDWEMP